jgi:hypothetical protein
MKDHMSTIEKPQVALADAHGKALIRKTPGVCGGTACIRDTRIMAGEGRLVPMASFYADENFNQKVMPYLASLGDGQSPPAA